MNRMFNIQIQRADNGFIAITRSDVAGVKSKRVIATTEDEIKSAAKALIDGMFDSPPQKEKQITGVTK